MWVKDEIKRDIGEREDSDMSIKKLSLYLQISVPIKDNKK